MATSRSAHRAKLRLEILEDRTTPVAVGTTGGRLAQIVVVDDFTGVGRFAITPYDNYQGPVRQATGDVNADGIGDVISVNTIGQGDVRVFSGVNGTMIRQFTVFPGYTGGLFVASGDLDGDLFSDILIATAGGTQGHVQAFSGLNNSLLASFFAYSGYTGPVQIAAGDFDLDNDLRADIITLAGTQGHIRAFQGFNSALIFSAIDTNAIGAVSMAAGDATGDRLVELYLSSPTGIVSVINPRLPLLLRSQAGIPDYQGPLSLAITNADGDFFADLAVGTLQGRGQVRLFNDQFVTLADIFPFGVGYTVGVTVG